MTTTNTPYNPLIRATRAAFAELTTLEARTWYRTQAKATATVAMAIAYNGTATVTRLLKPKPVPEVVADAGIEKIALTEDTAPEQANVPAVWLALEANEGAAVDEPEQAIAQTSPRPEQNDQAAKVYFMHSSDQAEKVAAMQLKYKVKPLESEQEVEPRSSESGRAVENSPPIGDSGSLLTYYSLLNLEESETDEAPPSDLSQRIQEYMRQRQGASDESVVDEAKASHQESAHPSSAPADSDSAAGAIAGD